jgi:hypothetical protein
MDNYQNFNYNGFNQKGFCSVTCSQNSSLMFPYYNGNPNTSIGLIDSCISINFNHTYRGFLPSNWILNLSKTLGISFSCVDPSKFTEGVASVNKELLGRKKVSLMHYLIYGKPDFWCPTTSTNSRSSIVQCSNHFSNTCNKVKPMSEHSDFLTNF